MSFDARSRELLQHYQEITSQPCEDPKDQAVRDGLARYDRLHREEGHTCLCAARQVYGHEPCSCQQNHHQGESMNTIDMRQLIEAAAANTKRLGFDVTQHATTIALIATEVNEALACLSDTTYDNTSEELHSFRHKLNDAAEDFTIYQRRAISHCDETTIQNQEHLDQELADVVIRVFSYVGGNGRTDAFLQALTDKMAHNATRPPLHGKGF